MTLARSPTQYQGVQAIDPPSVIKADRVPTTSDKSYPIGTLWIDSSGPSAWELGSVVANSANWIALGSGTVGAIVTLTGGSGGALSPTAGNFNLLGTANQITSTGSGSTITFSLPSAITAPGSLTTTTSLAATTTVTAGTGITSTTGNIVATAGAVNAGTSMTATLGNITATAGNFVSSTAGNGLVFNANSATGAAASPVVLNSRAGHVIFTSVSIAAAADLTLTITNSAITGSSTQVLYSMAGATTGSALSIKSVTNSAGSSAIVVTNGTGATTTTADITLTFIVVN